MTIFFICLGVVFSFLLCLLSRTHSAAFSAMIVNHVFVAIWQEAVLANYKYSLYCVVGIEENHEIFQSPAF
jgi:hypothetical protein